MGDSARHGLEPTVWAEVAARRERFRAALTGTGLQICSGTEDSVLSVEWVDVYPRFTDDLEAVEELRNWGISVLPGRLFHWRSAGAEHTTGHVRFSLLREHDDFERALRILAENGARGEG